MVTYYLLPGIYSLNTNGVGSRSNSMTTRRYGTYSTVLLEIDKNERRPTHPLSWVYSTKNKF